MLVPDLLFHFICDAIFVDLHLDPLTLTFEPLPEESVEHRAAVIAEGRRHVVVDLEPMRHIYLEPLRQHLSGRQTLSITVGVTNYHTQVIEP